MPLLLDTCTLLWLSSDADHLSPQAKEGLRPHAGDLFVSAISALECALLASKKKIRLPTASPEGWFRDVLKYHGIDQVPVNFQIASHSGELPPHHKDPYDRLIVATALEYRMTIVTPDELIRKYGVECLW
jgi:PIN domain nuclease of toxin-antitoxin system